MNRTARGIGIRAVILLIGIALVGIWLISIALKIAGAAIHFLLILGLVLVVAGALSYFARRIKRDGDRLGLVKLTLRAIVSDGSTVTVGR